MGVWGLYTEDKWEDIKKRDRRYAHDEGGGIVGVVEEEGLGLALIAGWAEISMGRKRGRIIMGFRSRLEPKGGRCSVYSAEHVIFMCNLVEHRLPN